MISFMTCIHDWHREALHPLRRALYNFQPAEVRAELTKITAPDTRFRSAFPIAEVRGAEAYYAVAYAPLKQAIPDLERREWICMAGSTDEGLNWVGIGGFYTGTFVTPWLDIPPTGHMVHMRFHEFYRFHDGLVVETQSLWDIPEVMMQAGAWPMAPSLGKEWHIPGPASNDGMRQMYDGVAGAQSCALVIDMLEHLKKHPSQGGPEVMEPERFWHPRMSWYGPAGIGTGRGFSGFRNWHQIPFLNAMPDRGFEREKITYHFFGDGPYCAVTGWPNMIQTLSHDGWLGIPPLGQQVTMKSLDFWRLEQGLIRENWVLVDLLDLYNQIGVDVLGRMREFNKARHPMNLSE